MLQKLSKIIMFNLTSIVMLLRVPSVLIWILPFIAAVIIWLLSLTPVAVVFSKPIQEIIAVCILTINTIVILIAHVKMRKFVTLWLLLLGIALLCRELHFYGTHRGFYIALILLVSWCAVKRVKFVHEIQSTGGARLLVGTMWMYSMAKVMDRDYLYFMPKYDEWHDYVEESMESVGHIMILVMSVIILRTWQKKISRSEESKI